MKRHTFLLKYFLLCLIGCLHSSLFSQRLERLSDSLTCYAQRIAKVDKVDVKACRERGKDITLTTNPTLSYLSLSEEQVQDLRRQVSFWVRGDEMGRVSIYTDGKEIGELITSRFRARRGSDKHTVPAVTPLVRLADCPYETSQGLQGKHIALWSSHGLYYKDTEDRWLWQRARLWTTVEDLFTASFTYPFLVPMLENAGAVVLQPRERDPETTERVAFVQNTMQQSLAMPHVGNYALYVRYHAHKDNARQVLYTVTHQGQTSRLTVNQQIGGNMWLYLGTFGFGTDSAANNLTVSIAKGAHGLVSHLGVKIGGGIGQSGMPRFAEAARYYLRYNGLPDSISTYEKTPSEYLDDLVSRGKWVNYLNENLHIPIDMAIAVHSDAGVRGGDSIVGTLTIYADKDKRGSRSFHHGGERRINRDLADYVQTQVVSDMQRTICPEWTRRELKNGGYAEATMPRVPTVLLEMLSHQNGGDMRYGLDPKAKFIIARAAYKGMLRFLHEQDGTPFVVQPLPVQAIGIQRITGTDSVRIVWQARHDSLEPTAAPTYFVLYTRRENSDWDNGQRLINSSCTLLLPRGKRYDFRVRAGNAGGVSLPGETLSAYIAPDDSKQALIINGFDQVSAPDIVLTDSLSGGIVPRSYAIPYGLDVSYIGEQIDFDRTHQWVSDDECGFGMCANDYAAVWTMGNTMDYAVRHGQWLQTAGYSFVSSSLAAADTLSKVSFIDLCMGKQAAGLSALTPAIQRCLNRHLMRGGKLMVSGSYLFSGWQDKNVKAWTETTLHCRLKAPRASQSGRIFWQAIGGDKHLLQLHTLPNSESLPCEAPDGLEPVMTGERLACYADSWLAAAVGTAHSILVLGFMPESLIDAESFYQQCINYLENH